MDSPCVLSLNIVPITTDALNRSRLIKNHRLMSVIEVFGDNATGSGQIEIEVLPNHFGWKEGRGHNDMAILAKVAPLPSYDVYALRRSLRDLGSAVNDHAQLKLTEEKN